MGINRSRLITSSSMTKENNIDILEDPQLVFDRIYDVVSIELGNLCLKYPVGAIDNIEGYKIGILKKVLLTMKSLRVVIKHSKDFQTAAAILRIIADSLSSYYLLYKKSKGEDSMLRHYLFLIDGMQDRINGLKKINPQPNSVISIEENNKTISDMNTQIQESEKAVEYCKKQIFGLSIYKEHQTLIDVFLSKPKDKWKYKSLVNYDTKSPNFSWKKMYSFVYDNKDVPTFFSYLSEFAHGLSASNLIIDITQQTFNPICVYAISLLGIIRNIVENDFSMNGVTELYNTN